MRLKFRLITIAEHYGDTRSLKFVPVSNGSEDNRKVFHSTPVAELFLRSVKKSEADAYVIGGEYFIDITPAPKA